jgi:histidine kinase
MAASLRTLGATLAETEARRTRLLGEVAHEMRTPLTVLDGHLEGMVDGVIPVAPQTVATLQAETRRLRRLSDDLSALSRAEEGRLGIVRQPIDLAQVAARAAQRLRPQADDADLTLVVDSPTPTMVSADADRIAQVVTNLVGNALRATPAGGRVEVRIGVDGAHAVVAVTDTGERFYRVPGARRGGSGESGSGIGLTISRGIALAHDGTLTAASPGPGQGATLTLRIPLA